MKPITKFSSGMERQVRDLVLDKFKKNPNATTVDIQYGDYGSTFNALPARLGLGRFTATKLDNGKIRIQDTFNVDKDFTTVGAADIVPGLQQTTDRIVDISYKNRNIKGRTDEGGIKIDVEIKGDDVIPKYQQNRNKLNNQRQQKTKTSDTFASVTSPQQTFSQMQQRIGNTFSSETETQTKNRRSNYTPQEIAQNRENLKNSIVTTATGVIDGARNLNRVNYALNLAKRQSVKSGGSTQITTIPPDSLGGKNNPVETKMHSQSKKAFLKSIDLNSPKDIASQIVDNSADAAAYALGFKAVHSQIPEEDGSQENNIKLNSKCGLEMEDNYAFRPDGYENFAAPVPIGGLLPGVP